MVTRERFESGMTYDEFKAQMTRNRERFEANERELVVDEADLAVFRGLPRPLNVLVLAEDWCGDVVANLPILGRLAVESGKLNLRVFLRDQNLDLMDQYLNRGRFRSIPVFVFFDEHFHEVGRFVERPQSVNDLRQRRIGELYARHPEFGSPDEPIAYLPEETRVRLMQEMAALREELAEQEKAEVVRELRDIVRRAKR